MEINEALYSYLSSYVNLTALVSNRIYPDVLPQNTPYPAITYQKISEDEIDTFNQTTSTLMMPKYQFTCWGSTRASSEAVAKQLRLAFKNYKSTTMGGVGGVSVSAIRILNRLSTFDTDNDGKVIAYGTISDFEVSYQEVT
jgi:hypothetical protein